MGWKIFGTGMGMSEFLTKFAVGTYTKTSFHMNEESSKPAAGQEPSASEPVAQSPVRRKSWARRYLAVPTILGLALVVYIAFFGEKSVTQRFAYQETIDSLQNCLARQQDTLEYYRDLNRRLSTDPALMEQVVREQYNMKRAHEDVYVVE